MNKLKIINKIKYNTKINKKIINEVLNSFIGIIKESLNKGEEVNINCFGRWYAKTIKSHKIYSPTKDSYFYTKQKIVPVFKVSKNFRIKVV